MSNNKPILAITMGDPAGIGPEIAVKTFANPVIHELCRPILVGSVSIMEQAQSISEDKLEIKKILEVNDAVYQPDTMSVLDIGMDTEAPIKFGKISAVAGELAFQSVIKAIDLAKKGKVDGTVTNPIHKKAINEESQNRLQAERNSLFAGNGYFRTIVF